MDIQKHREKIKSSKPVFNLVPLIDILFVLLIFLVVSSNFNASAVGEDTEGGTGKPNMTDSAGDSEYYLIPVSNLEKVIVDGQDMSSLIRNNAIGVHTKVIDQGEISIKPRERAIIITTPPGMSPQQAVDSPE